VCRGHQLLNVVRGGTLVEHLPDDGPITHSTRHGAPYAGDPDHVVDFVDGSIAGDVYGARRVTNSWHHQAVDQPGEGLVVTGRTADGVIETIELTGRPVIGVQWHPEWTVDVDPIFNWLVERSAEATLGRTSTATAQLA
jgi:putative glutamine amidotransferase